MYNNRIPYPFYTDNGDYRKFLGIIKDMSLWVNPASVFPIRVLSVEPKNDGVVVILQDASDLNKYILRSDSGYIHDVNGVISGIVRWDSDEVISVCSTLKGGDPIPWGTVYVLPIACKVKHKTPMFNVSVGGSALYGDRINISGDGNAVKLVEDSINLYQYDEDLNKQYINRITIKSGDRTTEINDIDGYVWLRSDAECDIRINTDSSIKIGTIIEGD